MQDTRAHADILRRLPLFMAAGDDALARLAGPAFVQQLPRGAVIFAQDREADFVHVALEGSVALTARAESGAETVVEIFRAGEAFLVPAVVLRLPYLASAATLTALRVMMIPADAFRDALARDAAIARAMTELLARHWRLMVDQVVDLKLRPAERRIARFLARRIAEEAGGGSAEVPEPRGAIAARLGMTPETLSRSLHALEAEGLIRCAGKRIDVPDRDRLLNHRREPR